MDERLRTTEIAGVPIHYNENHTLQNTNSFTADIANKENQKVFEEEKKNDGKESVILAPKKIVDYGKPFYDILSAEYLKRKGVQPSSPDQLIVFYQTKMKGGEYCFKDGERADDPASIKQTIYTYHQQKEKEIAELRKQRIQEMNLKKEKELKTQQIKNNTLRKTVIGKLGLGDANGSFCDEDLGVGSFVTQFQKDGRKDGRLVTPENVLEFVAAKEPKVDPLPTIEELQTFFDKKLSSVKSQYDKIKGVKTSDADVLTDYYMLGMSNEQKTKLGLAIDHKASVKFLFERLCLKEKEARQAQLNKIAQRQKKELETKEKKAQAQKIETAMARLYSPQPLKRITTTKFVSSEDKIVEYQASLIRRFETNLISAKHSRPQEVSKMICDELMRMKDLREFPEDKKGVQEAYAKLSPEVMSTFPVAAGAGAGAHLLAFSQIGGQIVKLSQESKKKKKRAASNTHQKLNKDELLATLNKKYEGYAAPEKRKGILRKAQVLFQSKNYIGAYNMICENFNLENIKKNLRNSSRPAKEGQLFAHFEKSKALEAITINRGETLFEEIVEMTAAIEQYEAGLLKNKPGDVQAVTKSAKPQKKSGRKDSEDYFDSGSGDEAAKENGQNGRSKKLAAICPLRGRCLNPNCELAHNHNELEFTGGQIKVSKASVPLNQHKLWKPNITKAGTCNGCGSSYCHACALHKAAQPVSQTKKRASSAQRDKTGEMTMNIATGLLKRAELLREARKYNESLGICSEGIRKLQPLVEADKESRSKRRQALCDLLGVNSSLTFGPKDIIRIREKEAQDRLKDKLNASDRDDYSEQDLHLKVPLAKALLIKKKDEEDLGDVKLHDLQERFNELYKALQKDLTIKKMGLTAMQRQLNKLDDQFIEEGTKVCPALKGGKCADPKTCRFAHNPREVNVVTKSRRRAQLEAAIEMQGLKRDPVKNAWCPGGKSIRPPEIKEKEELFAKRKMENWEEEHEDKKPNVWEMDTVELQKNALGEVSF